MNNHEIAKQVADRTAKAVAHYWKTRAAQRKKQEAGGKADQGLRSAVTGGAQMDGFIDLFSELVTQAGIPGSCIFRKKAVELPGFFRPTKSAFINSSSLDGLKGAYKTPADDLSMERFAKVLVAHVASFV